MPVRITKTKEAVPGTGSFAVHHDGDITYFYYDDVPGRRLRPEQMTQEQAKATAQEFARGVKMKQAEITASKIVEKFCAEADQIAARSITDLDKPPTLSKVQRARLVEIIVEELSHPRRDEPGEE